MDFLIEDINTAIAETENETLKYLITSVLLATSLFSSYLVITYALSALFHISSAFTHSNTIIITGNDHSIGGLIVGFLLLLAVVAILPAWIIAKTINTCRNISSTMHKIDSTQKTVLALGIGLLVVLAFVLCPPNALAVVITFLVNNVHIYLMLATAALNFVVSLSILAFSEDGAKPSKVINNILFGLIFTLFVPNPFSILGLHSVGFKIMTSFCTWTLIQSLITTIISTIATNFADSAINRGSSWSNTEENSVGPMRSFSIHTVGDGNSQTQESTNTVTAEIVSPPCSEAVVKAEVVGTLC